MGDGSDKALMIKCMKPSKRRIIQFLINSAVAAERLDQEYVQLEGNL